MSDSFEFTLHSPLTKEDWNKLTDAELEKTMSVTFQTPSGRQVKYIKCEVLAKIKAEIEELDGYEDRYSMIHDRPSLVRRVRNDCLKIIDKYKAESEGKK